MNYFCSINVTEERKYVEPLVCVRARECQGVTKTHRCGHCLPDPLFQSLHFISEAFKSEKLHFNI